VDAGGDVAAERERTAGVADDADHIKGAGLGDRTVVRHTDRAVRDDEARGGVAGDRAAADGERAAGNGGEVDARNSRIAEGVQRGNGARAEGDAVQIERGVADVDRVRAGGG